MMAHKHSAKNVRKCDQTICRNTALSCHYIMQAKFRKHLLRNFFTKLADKATVSERHRETNDFPDAN